MPQSSACLCNAHICTTVTLSLDTFLRTAPVTISIEITKKVKIRQHFTFARQSSMVFIALIFTKLPLVQYFLKKSSEFYGHPAGGLVTDTRSRTDRHGLHIRLSLCKEQLDFLTIIITAVKDRKFVCSRIFVCMCLPIHKVF